MDKIDKLFLEALKAALQNEKVQWDIELSPQEWIKLFHMAEIHHVLPMIFEAVFACPSANKTDSELFAPVRRRTIRQVMLQTVKTTEFLQLYKNLQAAGVKPLMIKGIICRELYPKPDHRLSGDEDMLILPEQFALCHRIMLENDMAVLEGETNVDIERAYEVPYGKKGSPTYIELHKYLFPPESEAYGDLNRFFSRAHEDAVEIPIQGVPVATLEYTSHLFYLICHAFKHFLHSGFGIRQVCDIVIFANVYGTKVDWNHLLEECRAIRAERFAAALFAIGQKYLTFSPENACYPEIWSGIPVDESALLQDLLSGGIYGNANMSRKHSSNITLNAVSAEKKGKQAGGNILKVIFPSLDRMQGRYPYLKKCPFLLPAAWISRLLTYRKEVSAGGENNAADSIRIGNERIELMRQYGIIGKEK